MCLINCQINSQTRNYTLEVNSVNLTRKSSDSLPAKEDIIDEATTSAQNQNSQPRHPQQQKQQLPHNQVQGREERRKLFYCRPKATTQQKDPTPKPQALPTVKSLKSHKGHQKEFGNRYQKISWSSLKISTTTNTIFNEQSQSGSQRQHIGNCQIGSQFGNCQSLHLRSNKEKEKHSPKVPPTKTKYCWKVKADLNKRKYLAEMVTSKDTHTGEEDQPSMSYNSTIPSLQQLRYHLMPPEIVIHRFAELKCINNKCQSRALGS